LTFLTYRGFKIVLLAFIFVIYCLELCNNENRSNDIFISFFNDGLYKNRKILLNFKFIIVVLTNKEGKYCTYLDLDEIIVNN